MTWEQIIAVPFVVWIAYTGTKIIDRWFDRKKKNNSLF